MCIALAYASLRRTLRVFYFILPHALCIPSTLEQAGLIVPHLPCCRGGLHQVDRPCQQEQGFVGRTCHGIAGGVALPDGVRQNESCRAQHGQVLSRQFVRLQLVLEYPDPGN